MHSTSGLQARVPGACRRMSLGPTNLAAGYRNVLFNLTMSGPVQIDKWPGADTSTVYGDGGGQYTGSGNIYWQPLVWWLDGYVCGMAVSFDGLAGTHDVIRARPGAFDRACTALRQLAEEG